MDQILWLKGVIHKRKAISSHLGSSYLGEGLKLLKCSSWQLMHWDTFKQDDYSTVGGDGGCRVGEVRAGTTSPMPDHKGLKLQ